MRPIRLDLHTHLCVGKRFAFHAGDEERFAAGALAAGLDGVLVSEHAEARGTWEAFDALLERHPFRRGRFEIAGALFYPGLEVTLAERVDVVLVGVLEDLRRLDRAFATRLSEGHRPGVEEFCEVMAAFAPSMARIGAHPGKRGKRLDALDDAALARVVDAVEVNAAGGGVEDAALVHGLAARLGCAVTGGSDAHAWAQVGAAWTEVYAQGDGTADVVRAIKQRRCEPRAHAEAVEMVESGRRLRSRLKDERKALETAGQGARLAA